MRKLFGRPMRKCTNVEFRGDEVKRGMPLLQTCRFNQAPHSPSQVAHSLNRLSIDTEVSARVAMVSTWCRRRYPQRKIRSRNPQGKIDTESHQVSDKLTGNEI